MEFTLIAACERCNEQQVFQGDTRKDNQHSDYIPGLADRYLNIKFDKSIGKRLCETCQIELENLRISHAKEINSFANPE